MPALVEGVEAEGEIDVLDEEEISMGERTESEYLGLSSPAP